MSNRPFVAARIELWLDQRFEALFRRLGWRERVITYTGYGSEAGARLLGRVVLSPTFSDTQIGKAAEEFLRRRGWRLTSNVYVSNQRHHGIEGDVVDIVLVPTDDPDKIAAYVSCATIGHEENQKEVRHSLDSLRFDG